MRDVGSNATTLDQRMSMLNPTFLAQSAGIASLVVAYNNLIGAMTNFAQQSIKTYSAFEKIQSGLTTYFNSADKGKAVFEDLRRLSNSTTFGVDELANSFTQLANSGVAVDTINDKLVMLGNIAGGSKEKFAELTSILAKIESSGRAGSVQIQQLALRGIPIRKVLQEMGVQGVATADQITEAFKRMTDEGGQFHNAMGNILDTIEGKEGEVSDFFKEFTVNFAEATGIAQAYKNALSLVRDALEQLADVFRNIGGDNPLFKALFSGTIVALLTSLAVVIGTVLVGAFIALNAQLGITATLMAVINPASVGIGLLVGGLVAGGVALGVWASEQERLGEDVDETTKKIREQEKAIADLRERQEHGGMALNENELMQVNKVEVSKLIAERKKLEKEIAEIRALGGDDESTSELMAQVGIINQQLIAYKEQNEELDKMWKKKQEILKEEREHLALIDKHVEEYQDAYNTAQEIVNNTKEAKLLKTIEILHNLQSTLASGVDVSKINYRTSAGGKTVTEEYTRALTKEEVEMYTKAIRELTKLISDSFKPEKWATILGNALGVNVTENNSNKIFKDYIDKLKRDQKDIGSYNMSNFETEFVKKSTNAFTDAIKTIISSGEFSKYQTDENGNYLKDTNGNYLKTNTTANLLKYGKEVYDNGTKEFGKGDIGTEEYRENIMKAIEGLNTLTELDETDAGLWRLKKQYEGEYLISLEEEYQKNKLSTDELKKQALMKAGMSEENAKKVIGQEKVNEQSKNVQKAETELRNAIGASNIINAQLKVAQANLVEKIVALREGVGENSNAQEDLKTAMTEYNKALAEKKANDLVKSTIAGSDAGDFVNGFENGGVWGGLIEMFFGALARAIGSIKGITLALSPITTMLKELAPIFKTFFYVCAILVPVFKALGNAIMKLLDFLTFGAFSATAKAYDEMIEELDGTTDSLKDMREDLKKLSDAIEEQAEYYLEKKRELNSLTYVEGQGWQTKSVNDMILTPQGNFSTHPDDYIIATKDPNGLGGGKGAVVMVQPVIQNYASNDTTAEVRTQQNGDMTQMIVMISKKVASDVANGDNGWDGAMAQREARIQGRRVSL